MKTLVNSDDEKLSLFIDWEQVTVANQRSIALRHIGTKHFDYFSEDKKNETNNNKKRCIKFSEPTNSKNYDLRASKIFTNFTWIYFC